MENKIKLTLEQEITLSKSYDWCTKVIIKQARFLPLNTMWQAYPFKNTGMTKDGLAFMLDNMQTQMIECGNVEIANKQNYIFA